MCAATAGFSEVMLFCPAFPVPHRIRWLHRQLGMEGVSGAERVLFSPSVPGTTASKLDSMLGGVQHVVEVRCAGRGLCRGWYAAGAAAPLHASMCHGRAL